MQDGFESLREWAEDYSKSYDQQWHKQRQLLDRALSIDSGLTDKQIDMLEHWSAYVGRDELDQKLLSAKQLKIIRDILDTKG